MRRLLSNRMKPASVRGALVLIVLAVLLPLLIVQGGIYTAWYYSQWSGQERQTLNTALEAAATFDAHVRDIQRQEQAIGAGIMGLRSYSTKEVNLFLSAAGQGYFAVRYWNWIHPDGKVTASSDPRAIGLEIGDREYFRELRAGRPWTISNLLIDRITGNPMFIIVTRVDDANGQMQGAVAAVVDIASLSRRAVALYHSVGEVLTLFDRDGVLVYSSERAADIYRNRRIEEPILANAMATGKPQVGVIARTIDGKKTEDYIVARAPIEELGWASGARRPVAHAMGEVYQWLWIVGGLNLAVVLGSGALALTASGSLIRQLRRLQSHAEAIGRGEFQHIAERTRLLELSELATAFNRMGTAVHDAHEMLEDRVRHRTAQLASAVERLERAQSELRSASLYARGLIEASLDPLVTISPEGQITDVNESTEAATGEPREKLVGSDFSNYFTEPDKARKGYQRVLTEGLVRDYPLTIRHVSGRTADVLYNAVVYRNEAGQVQGVFAAARDVTQQKATERELDQYRNHLEELVVRRTHELEAAHTQLQAVFNVVNVGMLLIDEQSRVEKINDTIFRWIGRDMLVGAGNQPGDLLGCVHALSGSCGCGKSEYCVSCPLRKMFESVLQSGQPVHDVETELALAGPDGEERLWLEVSADPLVIEDRRHVILALNNITARKQAEEILRQTAEQLARSNKELEQFAYVASHDLQEPLRVVVGYVQLLERRYQEQFDADAKDFFGFIVDGVTRMQQLITDLLNYSRIGTRGKEFKKLEMRKVVDRALANLQLVVEESGAEVVRGQLPTIEGDETQLVQLFQNLIGNGIKFHGESTPKIEISARREGSHWVFAVRDNGIGIEQQYWEQIFVIFRRLHTRQRYAGTGIGLAICKRIVERHGGKIWLESTPGQGTTFFFTLA